MAANDEDESTAVIVGVLAGIVLAVVAVTYGASAGKNVQPKAKPVAEQAEIAPVGEALAKVYFAVGAAALDEGPRSRSTSAPTGRDRHRSGSPTTAPNAPVTRGSRRRSALANSRPLVNTQRATASAAADSRPLNPRPASDTRLPS